MHWLHLLAVQGTLNSSPCPGGYGAAEQHPLSLAQAVSLDSSCPGQECCYLTESMGKGSCLLHGKMWASLNPGAWAAQRKIKWSENPATQKTRVKGTEVHVAQSCPSLCDCPWSSLGHSTGEGSLSLLQGNLPNPGMEPRSPVFKADSLPAEPPGKPIKVEAPSKRHENFNLVPKATQRRVIMWGGEAADGL